MILRFIVFSIAFLLFTYIAFRVQWKKDYKNGQKLSPLSSMLGVLVFAGHANSIYLTTPTKWPNLPQIPENQLVQIIFIIMLGIGIVILFASWFKLGTKTSMGGNKNKLQTRGLYRYSRNPQLVGYGLILASFALICFSYLSLIWFLLYLISAYFMVITEEEFLMQKYKEAYKDYCRQVPRIIKIL